MIIKIVVVGDLNTNCYIVASERTREALIIDPGDDAKKIINAVEAEKLKPVLIVNTHAHPDHIGANLELAKRYGIVAAVGKDDYEQIKAWGSYFEEFAELDIEDLVYERMLKAGDMVEAGELQLKVLGTPGHSRGSICLYGDGILFSGDTLFAGDCGRTDIPGGSESEMETSLAMLMKLPEGTKVYPGHGRSTTIGKEKKLYVKY